MDDAERHVQTNAELTAATASGLRWITGVRIATEVLLLASMVVLAHLIPPRAFGMAAIAVIVQELAVNVPSEGVASALVQRRVVERAHLQGGLALSLLMATALGAATLLVAALVVGPIFGGETAFLVALTTPWFLLGAILALPMVLLRRRLEFRRLSILSLVQGVVRAACSILLAAVFGLDAPALVWGGLAGLVATVVLALAFAPVPLPRWHGRAVRDLLPYGGPATVACFAWAGFRNGDYAIVGARLGAVQAGLYWRGFQLGVEYQRKVSAVMSQVAFPVLARTAGPDEMLEMRQRMVRLLTVVLFPGLALLAILAPVAVPWLFGPTWAQAVLPTQILAGAGAATVVIDPVGYALMASGRSRAMLGYGAAHFAVYATAVLAASSHGIAGVSIAAVSVHLLFVVVAYRVLLHGRPERTLRVLWDDVAGATVSCTALAAIAVPLAVVLERANVPAPLHVVAVSAAGGAAYLAALRIGFAAQFFDLLALVRRLLPRRRRRALASRVPALAGRSA